MRKREGRFTKFKWRITKKVRRTRDNQYSHIFYVVERKAIIFGIPFWWTDNWLQKTGMDITSYNYEKWKNCEDAYKQLVKNMEKCKWENQNVIERVDVINIQ